MYFTQKKKLREKLHIIVYSVVCLSPQEEKKVNKAVTFKVLLKVTLMRHFVSVECFQRLPRILHVNC